MRITHKFYTPIEIVAELVSPVGVRASHKKKFFDTERTSHDWLTAALVEKLQVVLESFTRYGSEVAETQSVRDYGVDVRLKFEDDKGSLRRIGFQLKSENEARKEKDRRRKKERGESMIAALKRQAFEAERRGDVDEWWIFSCFDLTTHRDLVNTINSEMAGGRSTSFKIRLVDPRRWREILSPRLSTMG